MPGTVQLPASSILTVADRPCARRSGRPTGEGVNRHGTLIRSLPCLCHLNGLAFVANSWALPIRDASCDRVCLDGVVEYVRDDEALIAEVGRVLRPGGRLSLRVPNAGPFAVFDAYNLYHYLADTTGRGRHPEETEEIGWRRHYGPSDVDALIARRFHTLSVSSRGLFAAELLTFAQLVAFRWLRQSDRRYRRSQRWATRLRGVERHLPLGRWGWELRVEAIRLPDPPNRGNGIERPAGHMEVAGSFGSSMGL
jgi:SAM-dependent methyltransferase